MLLRSPAARGFVRANTAFRARVGFSAAELAAEPLLHWIDPADAEAARATIEGGQASCRIRHRTRSGGPLLLELRVAEHDGGAVALARTVDEIEEVGGPEDADDEATVAGTLHTIARIVEEQNPGYRCSILLVADGRFVRGAGPSLPEEYNAAIDGYAVGPTVGSCGTAIYWNVPVIVEDIQADPLWVPFAELAGTAGVAACWSHPFASKTGSVLGALALYSPVPRAPTQEQLGRLRAAARMTGLAVERGRAEEAFRARRQRELELESQLRQAAKMEALGVLAGGVAHDFNNVLATILANAEFARELLPATSEVQELLSDIVEASQRAGQFCKQMLAYAGHGALTSTRFEVGALLREVDRLVQAAVSKKTGLEYELLDRPVYVEGDENQLLQVAMNLVTNAAEAIGEERGLIVVRSELCRYDADTLRLRGLPAELAPGEYVRLSVSDTGSGMDEETLARIFDPFFTTKFPGRGLGLSAVRGIITQHRGAIEIESEVGHGTTFAVMFPTVEAAQPDEAAPESSEGDTRSKLILVADDERALRRILCRRLRHAGFDVLEAEDGQEAIDVFAEHGDSIDCVLLDYSMPRRSGLEVQQALHSVREDLPIVLMSGFSELEVVERFQGAPLAASLEKPVSTAALLEAIRDAL
jgi:signal transduction histidine kinase